jgi:hypothetical protein
MRLAVVVIRKPLRQRNIQFPHVLMRTEVNALMLDLTPKPLDEHVVHPSPFAVHSYLRPDRAPKAQYPAFGYSNLFSADKGERNANFGMI